MIVRLFFVLLFLTLGMTFLGISVFTGFDPMRALAGCALFYVAKIV
ncbi:MAG: hypothetical protein ACYSTG_10495 [Planctomycetota bacterium]|jgi:hypothetical protein